LSIIIIYSIFIIIKSIINLWTEILHRPPSFENQKKDIKLRRSLWASGLSLAEVTGCDQGHDLWLLA